MSNRPTADELGREYAELKKAQALARTAATFAFEQHKAAVINPELMISFNGGAFTNEVADNYLHAFVVANDKSNEFERAMTKVRKQAWKWYRIVL